MFSIKLTQTNWSKSILRDLQEKKENFHKFKSQRRKTSNHNTLIDISTKTAKPFEIFGSKLADHWDPLLFVFLSRSPQKRQKGSLLLLIYKTDISIIAIINKAHFKSVNIDCTVKPMKNQSPIEGELR